MDGDFPVCRQARLHPSLPNPTRSANPCFRVWMHRMVAAIALQVKLQRDVGLNPGRHELWSTKPSGIASHRTWDFRRLGPSVPTRILQAGGSAAGLAAIAALSCFSFFSQPSRRASPHRLLLLPNRRRRRLQHLPIRQKQLLISAPLRPKMRIPPPPLFPITPVHPAGFSPPTTDRRLPTSRWPGALTSMPQNSNRNSSRN